LENPRSTSEPSASTGEFTGFRAVFEAAPDGIVVVDAAGRIREVNPEALAMLGYDRDELLGAPVERVVPAEVRSRHVALRDGFMESPHTRGMGAGLDLRAVRKDGRQLPVEVSLRPCITPEGRFVIATMRDVSERKRLQNLGTGALRAAEEERERIARELHDDTAQCLAALLVRLELLQRSGQPEQRQRLMDEMHHDLQEAVEGVRRIARGLRPPALADVGVEAAIRSQVRSLFQLSPVEVTVELGRVGERLHPEAQLVVYRVVQEALTNVVRHSGARRVGVTLTLEGGEVVASVEDDGEGFDPEGLFLEGGGLGLLGMHERARIVGGYLRIRSSPGEGSQVTLRVPVQGGADA